VQDLQKDILQPLNAADQARFIELMRKVVWAESLDSGGLNFF